MNTLKTNKVYIPFLTFFVICVFVLAEDYGISWDEDWHRTTGKRVGIFIGHKIGLFQDLTTDFPNQKIDVHGVVFDTIAASLEELFGLDDSRDIYFMRHKLNIIIYLIGAFSIYLFSQKIFKSNKYAIIALLFYLLNPRLFANGFFNMKDSITQSYVAMTLYPAYLAFSTDVRKWFIVAGIFSGLCAATRIPLVYIPFYFTLICIIKNYYSVDYKFFELSAHNKNIIYFNLTFFFSFYTFWPLLWNSPFQKFTEVFMLTKSYIIRNNQYFLGDYVNSAEIPISYLPIWIGITLPLIFLICFVGGTIKTINNWINNRIEIKNHFEVFLLISLFTPILAAIIFNSTLYDSWRQFYFIYPFMVYFILIGFKYVHSIIEKKLHSKSIIVFLSIAVFSPSIFSIVSMHPNQYAFFNVLAGQDPMKNFDGDYWGLSYKQGLEYIAENDTREKIKISVRNSPGRHNIKILEKKDRDRFEYVENIKESNYYLTNYRWKMKENYHLAKIDSHPVGKEYFSVNIGQMKILGVYKINLND